MDISAVHKNQPLISSFKEFAIANPNVCHLIRLKKYNTSDVPFDIKSMTEGEIEPFTVPKILHVDPLAEGYDSYKLKAVVNDFMSDSMVANIEVSITPLISNEPVRIDDYENKILNLKYSHFLGLINYPTLSNNSWFFRCQY